MRNIIILFSLLWFICVVPTIPIHLAGDCKYGAVQAWVRTADGRWENATTHPVLRRGESFEIRINVTTTTTLNVFYLKLHEFGEPVYEVLGGPTAMEQFLEVRPPILLNPSHMYHWKMRVRMNTSWVNGFAPLEVYVQFNRNDDDDARVNFDVMTAFIKDALWEKCTYSVSTDNLQLSQDALSRMKQMTLLGGILLLFFIRIFFHVQLQYYLVKPDKGS